MIDVTLPAGVLDASARDALTEELARVLLHWEGAPDTEFFRANTWIFVREYEAEELRVGGSPGAPFRIRVEITTPQGALSQRRRDGLVADATAAVSAAYGLSPEEGFRVWVLLSEITEGGWGAGGGVVRFEALKAAARAERDAKAVATAG
jgi:phenylpyruvate tautomerase PptA (4-oxalocrotonate tautomerase family)